jgi:hypothetical protein
MQSNRPDTNSDVNCSREDQYRIFVLATFRLRILIPDSYLLGEVREIHILMACR